MKEIQVLMELLDVANRQGAFSLAQSAKAIKAINTLVITLERNGIIHKEDETEGSLGKESTKPSEVEEI